MSGSKGLPRGLYAIADSTLLSGARLTYAVAQAIEGGATAVQYRDKGSDPRRRHTEALALAQLCRVYDVPLIVNDDMLLARTAGAAGVHLGRGDPSIAAARKLLGRDAIIGVSCYNDLAMAVDAQARGADYVAFGAFFPSPTKPDAVRAEPTLLRQARRRLRCTIVAIGGITPDDGAALLEAGADALAVISGVFGQQDPAAAARRYGRAFQRTSPKARPPGGPADSVQGHRKARRTPS